MISFIRCDHGFGGLCIKTSFGGMHAEVFVHKFVQCLQFDLKMFYLPLHTPPKCGDRIDEINTAKCDSW